MTLNIDQDFRHVSSASFFACLPGYHCGNAFGALGTRLPCWSFEFVIQTVATFAVWYEGEERTCLKGTCPCILLKLQWWWQQLEWGPSVYAGSVGGQTFIQVVRKVVKARKCRKILPSISWQLVFHPSCSCCHHHCKARKAGLSCSSPEA